MKRLLALLIALFVLCGCKAQGPPGTDPFFGRTTVPPPGTGSISGGPTDPYYGGAPSSLAPSYVPPATGAQPPASSGVPPYAPQGGFNSQGSSWSRMGSPLASRTETRVAPPSPSDRSRPATPKAGPTPAGRERVVQILQPRAKTAASSPDTRTPLSARASTADEPRRLPVTKGAVEITDLPPAGRVTSATRPESASGRSGVRLASGTEDPDDSAAVKAAVGVSPATTGRTAAAEFAPRADYGYDPEYRWLRGKLEYSQIDRRWKLRYIPVDGTTDQFGGSVVLPDPKLLAGCERGDFVEVRGQVGQKTANSGYAPRYEVAEVKRLSQATR